MKKKLNIFFTIDKNYIQHFVVTLTSILENNRDLQIQVYVIHDIKNPAALKRATDFLYERYRLTIELLSLDAKIFEKFKISFHVSKATYFRLLLADIIPANVDTGLFIDSDIVVTGTLDYFVALNFDDTGDEKLLYAIDDPEFNNVDRLNKLGFPATKYFNAGVMYINLKAWRQQVVSGQLIEIADKYKKDLVWWDQDVLNMLFFNKWAAAPVSYNAFGLAEKQRTLPIIIHYTGSLKPWDYGNTHPYRPLYFDYLKLTPFKSYNPFIFLMKRKIKTAWKMLKSVFC